MWLNTVDVFSPSTYTSLPTTSLPKECAYGSAVAIGQRLFYVGGGNGIDWFSSMLRLSLDDEEAQWEQVSLCPWPDGSLLQLQLAFMQGKVVFV